MWSMLAAATTTMSLAACLDPVLIDEVEVEENHAPVISTFHPEPIHPLPGPDPVKRIVGPGCVDEPTFGVVIEDVDADGEDPDYALTVRWVLVVKRAGVPSGARERFAELELQPLPERGPQGEQFDLPDAVIDEALLRRLFDDLDRFDPATHNETQLLELRVSDGGFNPGEDDEPRPGAGFLLFTWTLDIEHQEAGCAGGG
jgi:hypothetical protein